MKNYLMELVALVSLLLMVGLVAWHSDGIGICQAADKPQATPVAAPADGAEAKPEIEAKPETEVGNQPPAPPVSPAPPEPTPAPQLTDNAENTAPPEPPATGGQEQKPGWSNPLVKPEQPADGVTQATPEAKPEDGAGTAPAPVDNNAEAPAGGQPE